MVSIEVPYYSQLDNGSEYFTNDCLAACFRMVWGWHRLSIGKENPVSVTVNTFSQDIYQSTADLGSVLDIYKLVSPRNIPYNPVSGETGITPNRIRASIDAGYPVIALVLYSKIRAIEPIGHFVVVVGYDDANFIIHDPYYENELGANLEIDQYRFEYALRPEKNPYFNYPYQGLLHWNLE